MEQKAAWWYKQSGVIPYRIRTIELSNTPEFEVLLITSRKRKRWIIPKGIIEPNLTPQASAEKEAIEEAGVAGNASERSLGSYTHKKWRGTCHIEVFPLEVTEEFETWPESTFRDRKWMSIEEAVELLDNDELKSIFKKLKTLFS
ncbi:NUDIX hydrolase [candidate division KSB3 bacterium]|uniref:NUDIX hydrolase n=1 Tax=candidate division KSB3 bacterium TaxID=2044937 RepID=A0A2G6KD75_9BACT|nr:MAG: NUDIX hydrolase [candidate division KSB3 bacterium]